MGRCSNPILSRYIFNYVSPTIPIVMHNIILFAICIEFQIIKTKNFFTLSMTE